ncbi:MAG: Uncharacterized protein XD41_0058 [Desulfonauticus sp. 38_4375]|nr:MAG: Uncharacterized protein XD41_0058 [Desulfonauticus sp. 38_4375]
MRSYYIEELNQQDMEKIKKSFKEKKLDNPLDNLYWLPLPQKFYTSEQKEHLSSCGPYYFPLELGKNWLKAELLIRASNKIRCQCITYATPEQREYLVQWINQLLAENQIFI